MSVKNPDWIEFVTFMQIYINVQVQIMGPKLVVFSRPQEFCLKHSRTEVSEL